MKELLENNVSNSPSAIKARTEVLAESFQMSLFAKDDPKQEEILARLKGSEGTGNDAIGGAADII